MVRLIGIDEAGYGPLMGPLVVTSASLDGPEEACQADLWDLLSASVARNRRHLAGRLLITDSKKAFVRSSGLGHLERTVLSVLQMQKCPAGTLAELLTTLCPQSLARLHDYPWYQDLDQIVLPFDDPDKAVAAAALSRDLERQQIRMGSLHVACLDVGYYNDLVTAVRNKSNVLFTVACSLIQEALKPDSGERGLIIVDRQGGRTHYRDPLRRMFPQMELTIIEEGEQCSRYRLVSGQQDLELAFQVKADRDHLLVSLASMVSKYVRELLMTCINRYFRGFCPDLTPTAGYWQDGQRFLQDLASRCPQVGYEENRLVRCR